MYADEQRPQSDSMSTLRFIKGRKQKRYEISPSGKYYNNIFQSILGVYRTNILIVGLSIIYKKKND